jgi:hypothetical protein
VVRPTETQVANWCWMGLVKFDSPGREWLGGVNQPMPHNTALVAWWTDGEFQEFDVMTWDRSTTRILNRVLTNAEVQECLWGPPNPLISLFVK